MGNDPNDSSNQLTIQQQINKVLNERAGLLRTQESILANQVQLAVDLCKALNCDQLDDIEKRLQTTRQALKDAAADAGKLGDELDDAGQRGGKAINSFSDALEVLKERLDKINPAIAGGLIGGFTGLTKGVSSAWQSIKNLNVALFGIIKSIAGVALAIISIPFKIFQGIFELAQGSGGGPPPILVELENIRKQFGNLATNEGRAVKGALSDIRDEYGNIAKSGLSVRRIFGTGYEGIAKFLEETRELATAMGTALNGMMDVIKTSAPELTIYRKGMGMTAEQQAAIMKFANFSGKKPLNVMRQFASMSIQMGQRFGVNAKLISRGMAEMAADVANFGHLGPKAFGSIATWAHKLGVEIKDLTGVMNAFSDFDTAAQNVAKLSQAFGIQLDTIQMIEAEDPAAMYDMIMKGMRESGTNYDSLNRQSRKYLSTLTQIPEAAASAAFGHRGLNMSYKEFQRESAKVEKKVMTQDELMKKLAKSIERVFPSGGGTKFKSFLDAFLSGFRSGILRTWEFRRALRALRHSIRAVFWSGRRVGRMFVKEFPGVKKMLDAFRDVFHPRRFRELMRNVEKAFSSLFKTLKTDPKAGVKRFLDDFKNLIKNFFTRSGPGVRAFIEGGKQFLSALKGIFDAVFPMVLDGLAKGANLITEFLTRPPDLASPLTKAFNKFSDAMLPLFTAITDKLAGPFGKMFNVLWEKAKPYVMEWANFLFKVAFAKIIFNAVWGALIGAAGAVAGKVAGAYLLRLFGLSDVLKKAKDVTPAPVTGGVTTAAAAAADPPAAGKWSWSNPWVRYLAYLGAIIAAIALVMIIYKTLDYTIEDAIGLSVLVASFAASTAMIAGAMKMVPPAGLGRTIKTKLATMGLIIGAVVTFAMLALYVLKDLGTIKEISPTSVTAFMAILSTLIAATIPVIIGGAVIGAMKETAGKALIGMGIIAGVMGGIGFLTVAIGKLIESSIDNPEKVASILSSMTTLITTVSLMIPAAVILGLMASSKIGLVGVATVVAGFVAVGFIAGAIVSSLIPTIREISAISLPDPESFKAITSGMESILKAMSSFMYSSALMAFMLSPDNDEIDPGGFERNTKAFSALATSIINSGIGKIINDLISFAKFGNVREGTADVISSIASIMSAAGSLMAAFSPSGEVLASMGSVGWGDILSGGTHVELTGKVLEAMKHFAAKTGPVMKEVLPILSSTISSLVMSLGNVPPGVKDVAPLVSSLGVIFTGAASLMSAISPSDAAWNALSNASGDFIAFMGHGREDVQTTFDEDVVRKIRNFPIMLENIKIFTIEIIKGIKGPIVEMLTQLSGVSLDNLKDVIPLVSSVIQFATGIASGVSPLVDAAVKVSEKAPAKERVKAFGDSMAKIKDLMWNMGPALVTMIEPLKGMIMAMIGIAGSSEFKNTKGLKGKIEVISATFTALGEMSKLFSIGGSLSLMGSAGKFDESLIQIIVDSMNTVTEKLLNPGGPIFSLVSALSKLNITGSRDIKSKASAIKALGEALGEIVNAFTGEGGIARFGSTTFGAGPDARGPGLIASIKGKIDMFTTGSGKGIFAGMMSIVRMIPRVRASDINGLGDSLVAIVNAFTGEGGIARFGSTTFGGGPDARGKGLIASIQEKIELFTSGQGGGIFRGMKAVIDTVPRGIESRAQSINTLVSDLASISNALGSANIDGTDLSAVVNLTNALNGRGGFTIDHKNLNLSIKVEVNMSAEQIANGILKVNDVMNVGVPGKQKFMTERAT